VYCVEGYGTGVMAPRIRNTGIGEYLCSHHTLLSHAETYHMYKEKYFSQFGGRIGITLNSAFYMSLDGSNEELIRDTALQFDLGWYMHPLFIGNYPQVMIDKIRDFSEAEGLATSRLPFFAPEEIVRVRGTVEFLGLNYYTSRLANIAASPDPEPSWSRDTGLEFSTSQYWEQAESEWLFSVPDGLRGLLK
jgi:beta-glucosidase/6-phospho-beta-glucosidase/beta-galactosidase